MQCPSCGFENIPGRDRCTVCSTALSAGTATERTYPIRARDRSLWQRIAWRITSHPTYARLNREAGERRRRFSNAVPRLTWGRPQWLGFRELGLLILSAIPGMGHIRVLGQKQAGVRMLLISLLSLAAAVPLYRTVLSGWLVYSVIAMSIYSVCAAACHLRGQPDDEYSRGMIGLGIALLVFSIYLGSYMIVRMAIQPYATTGRVTITIQDGPVAQNDNLLLFKGELAKGDLAAGTIQDGTMTIGPIIGVPGDLIEVSDSIHVNGTPTRYRLAELQGELGPGDAAASESRTLGAGEYWVMPLAGVQANDRGAMANTCVMRQRDMLGRAVAVISPASHRQRLHRIQIFER